MEIITKFSIGDKVRFPYFPYQSNTLTAVGYISGIMINVGKDEINTRYMVTFPYTCSGVAEGGKVSCCYAGLATGSTESTYFRSKMVTPRT